MIQKVAPAVRAAIEIGEGGCRAVDRFLAQAQKRFVLLQKATGPLSMF
jgi:hypothetical protein